MRIQIATVSALTLLLGACGQSATEPTNSDTLAAPAPAEVKADDVAEAMAPGGVAIVDAWVRPPVGDRAVAAGYGTISVERGNVDVISVASPIAESVELHTHLMNDEGVMRMVEIETIPVSSEKPTVMRPGGKHLMMFGVTQAPEMGSTVPLTFTFNTGETLTVDALVRAATEADMGESHDHGDHSHDHGDHSHDGQ